MGVNMSSYFNRKNKEELGALLSRLEADKTSNFYQDLEKDPGGLFSLADHALKATLRKLAAEERAQNAFFSQLRAGPKNGPQKNFEAGPGKSDRKITLAAGEKTPRPARLQEPGGLSLKPLGQKPKAQKNPSLLAGASKIPFGQAEKGEGPNPRANGFQWDDSLRDDLRDLFEALEKVLEKLGRF
ncbi:MAG: hypothetical protein LBF38_06635 [Deltaproteobacteria bacterium]|jgi:hypothetical protein|nr:hypothetical protein [Deltaproteobacteria bacterium]